MHLFLTLLFLLLICQEFKFNVSAKSFVPSQVPLRPTSPVADTPFYYPTMHGMPVGVEVSTHFSIATLAPYYHSPSSFLRWRGSVTCHNVINMIQCFCKLSLHSLKLKQAIAFSMKMGKGKEKCNR